MSIFLSSLAGGIIRFAESLGLRGGPSILRFLSATGIGRGSLSTVRLHSGQLMRFPTLDHYWSRYMWAGVPYEPDVEWILDALSTFPDKVFADCGANIGYWTVRMSDARYNFSDLIAIEANPALVTILNENVCLNNISVEVIHPAVSEKCGQIVKLSNTFHHAIASVGDEGIPVSTINLTNVLASRNLRGRLTVVKLDIEGSEIPALRGMPPVDTWHPVFVYEDWPTQNMPVTQFLLQQGLAVIAAAPRIEPRRIERAAEAVEFHALTAQRRNPSNLVACSRNDFPALFEAISGYLRGG